MYLRILGGPIKPNFLLCLITQIGGRVRKAMFITAIYSAPKAEDFPKRKNGA